jgi:hypothetical protein
MPPFVPQTSTNGGEVVNLRLHEKGRPVCALSASRDRYRGLLIDARCGDDPGG